MDSATLILWTWRNEAICIIVLLVIIGLLYKFGKPWLANASLTIVLCGGLAGAGLPLIFHWNVGISPRALFCILLYIWCVMGMLFIAGRQTHFLKLMIALVSQAVVVYTLFRLI